MSPDPATEHIPLLVQVCCGIVEDRGLSSVGIYRVPGNSAAVVTLTEQVRHLIFIKNLYMSLKLNSKPMTEMDN